MTNPSEGGSYIREGDTLKRVEFTEQHPGARVLTDPAADLQAATAAAAAAAAAPAQSAAEPQADAAKPAKPPKEK